MPSIFFKKYLTELTAVLSTVSADEIKSLVDDLSMAYSKGLQIFICGNGGSASTAAHFACDINKGVSFGKVRKFKVICLNDNLPTIMAYANDVSYNDIFVEQLKNFMSAGDMVIGLSGSGNSENVLRAIRYGNEIGGLTYGICGYGGGELKKISQKSVVIYSNDMQKIEDAHLIVLHSIMQWFNADQDNA